METSQGGDGSSDGGGGGEVRQQVHIVYFLSRKGVVEQPHLLNLVFTGNDIYLRDVKRWLAALRGKDMPESFAWSCKRKYKYGCYVWQDLIDEDLITPLSDNEFVLKGSQISSSTTSTSTLQDCTESEEYLSMQKEELLEEQKQEQLERKKSSEIEEESPKSTLTDDSIKSEEDPKISETCPKDGDDSSFSSSSYLSLFNKKPKKTTHSVTMKKTKPSSEKSSPKSNSHGMNNGASKIFRSFINCRNVNTKDSIVAPSADRQIKKPCLDNGSDVEAVKNESAEICRIDDKLLGGSQRSYRKKYPWEQPQNGSRKSCDGVTETTVFCGPRTSFTTYMPVSCPNCSQCGKKFKPEKLHSHMKSCKGIKASAAKGTKPANPHAKSAEKPALSENPAEFTHNQPVSACT